MLESSVRCDKRAAEPCSPTVVVTAAAAAPPLLASGHLDVEATFVAADAAFFGGRLRQCGVRWRWSDEISRDAGAYVHGRRGRGRGGGGTVTLFERVLHRRPPRDVRSVFLHELIHAYLHCTNVPRRQASGHGPRWAELARRINCAWGTNVQPHHDFVREVAVDFPWLMQCRVCAVQQLMETPHVITCVRAAACAGQMHMVACLDDYFDHGAAEAEAGVVTHQGRGGDEQQQHRTGGQHSVSATDEVIELD